MFKHFFGFEVKFWLRGWMVWIFFLIVGLLFFGAVSSDQITVGNTLGNTYKNAPWVIENLYASDLAYLQRLYEKFNAGDEEAAPELAAEKQWAGGSKTLRRFTAVGEA